jgi:hypothetical protein
LSGIGNECKPLGDGGAAQVVCQQLGGATHHRAVRQPGFLPLRRVLVSASDITRRRRPSPCGGRVSTLSAQIPKGILFKIAGKNALFVKVQVGSSCEPPRGRARAVNPRTPVSGVLRWSAAYRVPSPRPRQRQLPSPHQLTFASTQTHRHPRAPPLSTPTSPFHRPAARNAWRTRSARQGLHPSGVYFSSSTSIQDPETTST